MTTRSRLLVTALVLGFFGFLLYGTLSSQKVVCTVDVEFRGAHNTARASAENEAAARQQAQETACGTLAAGMNDRIACSRTVPVRQSCQPA